MRAFGFLLLCIFSQSAQGLKIDREHESLIPANQRMAPGIMPKMLPQNSQPKAASVFYLVVMGKLAYRHQVSTWLSSLRKVGGWKGEAVIVTDKPGCLEKTLTEAKLLGSLISSDDNVNIYGPALGYHGNTHMIKRPTTKNILKMKLEKARAWLNLKVARIPHPVTSIVYTDEDVVIGKDLGIFMSQVKDLEGQNHTLALFRDTGMAAGELHTGIVVMFPGAHTDECLQQWGKKLTGIRIGSSQETEEPDPALAKPDSTVTAVAKAAKLIVDNDQEFKEGQLLAEEIEEMGPDQQALGRTRACKKAASHQGIKILPGRFFWLPVPGGLKRGKLAEFVHFTNTGRWMTIPHGLIKKYLYRTGIPEHIDPMGHVQDKTCQDDKAVQ